MTDKKPFSLRSALTPRNIAKAIIGGSTHFVVSTVIYKIVEPEDRSDRAKTFVGSHAIAGLVTAKVCDRVDDQFDEWAEDVEELKEAVAEAQNPSVPTDPTP